MSRDTLEYYKEDNFSFLEKIRSIHTVNRIPVTLSMGIALFPSEVIAAGKANFSELATKARAGLDLALGRGGDQVVVYEEDGSPHFYGGKTRCVEKNTRVRARVVAQAIHELIDTCDMVLVMGHEREDYDSIGAAVGVATWPVWQASRYTSSSATRPMPSGAWKTRSWTIRTSRTCSFRQRRREHLQQPDPAVHRRYPSPGHDRCAGLAGRNGPPRRHRPSPPQFGLHQEAPADLYGNVELFDE